MILEAFSTYLKTNTDKNSILLLNEWIKLKIKEPSFDKISNVIKNEIYLCKTQNKKILLIGKRESGRKLLKALYNYAISFEQYKIAKEKHEKNLKK